MGLGEPKNGQAWGALPLLVSVSPRTLKLTLLCDLN